MGAREGRGEIIDQQSPKTPTIELDFLQCAGGCLLGQDVPSLPSSSLFGQGILGTLTMLQTLLQMLQCLHWTTEYPKSIPDFTNEGRTTIH